MTAKFRTESGGRLKRGTTVDFSFDGKLLQGYAGDTLASALLANGIHLMARSFKYHRPRGVMTAGSEEPNALIQVKRDAARVTPNLRATQIELYQGLQTSSQNRWPSLSFDVGEINDVLSPIFCGRFLLQDLHVAALVLEVGLRAPHPRRRRVSANRRRCRTPTAISSATPIATCLSSALARPA